MHNADMNENKKKVVREILTVSAQAYIKDAMENSGLQYMVEFQAYRAKLTVKLSARNKLTFYVNYKKMTQDLPKALDNMEILRHTLEQYGSGVTVKLNNGCERWK